MTFKVPEIRISVSISLYLLRWKNSFGYLEICISHLCFNILVECLKALGYMERAAESYGKVVDLAPLHLDARISLSTLQQQLGRPEKALEALEPMYDPDTLAQDANAAQQVSHATLSREFILELFPQGYLYRLYSTLYYSVLNF